MRYTSLILALAAIATTLTEAQPAPASPATTTPAASGNGTTTSGPPTPNFPIQTFESTPCTQCTFASFPKEASCAALVPVDMQQLQAAFTPTSVDINAIITAVNGNPAIKNCVCHWTTGTFNQTTGGAAASCLTSEPSVPGPAVTAGGGASCNATQATQAEGKFGLLGALIHCDAVVSHSTGRPTDSESATASSSSGPASAVGVGAVVSVGAIVLAMVGAL
ncbi:hypothetical protein EC957_004839 [Mortierella hygrophila]|uniref:Uncharacterized protein n=1 Tax=Mortierella hygrophila TaxID=979708 RepID=A0A9P6F070_9FUNG|nr:hypothetical protein EC957_004839 [Mortierella hygrophila]